MLPESLPIGVHALNSEWLTHVLWEAGALATGSVTGFRAERLSNHHALLLRLRLQYDQTGSAPPTLIAKFPVEEPVTRAYYAEHGYYEREVNFYQKIAQRSRLRTPICYYASLDAHSGNSVLLLEDLAPARTVSGECSYAEAALAVQEIAKLHYYWWRNLRLDSMEWLPALDSHYYQGLQNEIEGAWAPFLAKMNNEAPPLLKVADSLRQHLPALARLGQEPQTVIHYGFSRGNVLFDVNGGETPFAVVDWQLVRRGRGPLDVATFLGASIAPAQRRKDQMALLRLYYDALLEGWVARYSLQECFDDYRLAMLDCLARSIILVGTLPEDAERTRAFLRYAAAVLDLHADEFLR